LALVPSTDVKVPRIASAPAALECRWLHSVSFTTDRELLLAEVVRAWTRDGVMDDKFNVDFAAYQPVGRLYYNTRKPEVFVTSACEIRSKRWVHQLTLRPALASQASLRPSRPIW
jgi:flavin reductase (DIM6/NTAB) family NADH-FMN oxidoreductase RutF